MEGYFLTEGQCWKGLLLEGLQLRGGGFVNSSLSVRAVGSQVSKRGVGHENIYCVLAHLSELMCGEWMKS